MTLQKNKEKGCEIFSHPLFIFLLCLKMYAARGGKAYRNLSSSRSTSGIFFGAGRSTR